MIKSMQDCILVGIFVGPQKDKTSNWYLVNSEETTLYWANGYIRSRKQTQEGYFYRIVPDRNPWKYPWTRVLQQKRPALEFFCK